MCRVGHYDVPNLVEDFATNAFSGTLKVILVAWIDINF